MKRQTASTKNVLPHYVSFQIQVHTQKDFLFAFGIIKILLFRLTTKSKIVSTRRKIYIEEFFYVINA